MSDPQDTAAVAASPETQQTSRYRNASWCLILVAIALRAVRFAHDRALWLDEAYLALNLRDRSFGHLAQRLDDQQYAPYGFLATMKAFILALGQSEWAYRAFPFVVAILATPMFYALCRRMLRPSAVPWAMLLYAVSFPLLVYAAEAKVYGIDAFVATALVWMASRHADELSPSLRQFAALGLAGAVSVWFSFPACFVLAGIGLSLAAQYAMRRDWRRTGYLALSVVFWLLSFGGQAWLMFRPADPQLPSRDLGGLQDFYSDNFLPRTLNVADISDWLMHFFATLAGYFTSDVAAGLAVLALVLGCIPLWKTKRYALLMLLAPIVIGIAVSATRLYPMSDRFTVFLAPAILIVVAAGLDEFRVRAGRAGRLAWIIVIVLLLFQPVARAIKQSISPDRHGDSRAVIARLEKDYQPGDTIFLHWSADPQYRFYAHTAAGEGDIVRGKRSERWDTMQRDLEPLVGRPRVWVFFSFNAHHSPAGRFMRDYLGAHGKLLEETDSEKNAVYLYDLRGVQGETAP